MRVLSKKLMIVLLFIMVFVTDVNAQELSEGVQSLKGIKGVFVIIEKLTPDIEKDGLTKNQIQTDVELKLRLAGIKVLTEEESFKEPGSPLLYITVNALKIEALSAYSFSIGVSLKQDVNLTRNSEIKNYHVATWGIEIVGFTAKNSVVNDIRDYVKNLEDMFLNDYLTANPK